MTAVVALIDHTQPGEGLAAKVARLSHGQNEAFDMCKDDERDKRTLRFLFDRNHLTPFEFLRVTFYVQCPIYVARQLMRYRCASYLERSLRYCEPIENVPDYKDAIDAGMKREEARALLPLSTATAYYFTTNMREMFHIFDERLDRHAQEDTRRVVEMMKEETRRVYPYCVELWEKRAARFFERA